VLSATGFRAGRRCGSIRSCAQYVLNTHVSSILDEQLTCHEGTASYAQNMSEQETFGDRLRRRMKEKNITMPELGRGLKPRKNGVLDGDLGRAAVYGWLNGNGFPNVMQLAAICQKLDTSADFLLFGNKVAVSPKVERAAQVMMELSDEERLALFAVIQGPSVSDEQVEQVMPITRAAPFRYEPKTAKNPLLPAEHSQQAKQATGTDDPARPTLRRGMSGHVQFIGSTTPAKGAPDGKSDRDSRVPREKHSRDS